MLKFQQFRSFGFIVSICLLLAPIVSVADEKAASKLMQQGFDLRLQGEQIEKKANALIANSAGFIRNTTELRRQLSAANILKAKNNKHVKDTDYPAQLYALSEKTADGGAELRVVATELKSYARELINLGFYALWEKHVDEQSVTKIRGTGAAAAHSELMQMTFTAQNRPDDLDLQPGKPTANALYYAHIQSGVDEVQLNQLHSWKLILTDAKGSGVKNAKITISGDMPSHMHGLATLPSVKDTSVPGVYEISGMKFQMRGWWTLSLKIETDSGVDTVTYNMDI